MNHIKKEAYRIILTLGMVTCPITSATLFTNMDIELRNVMSLRRKFKRVPLKKQSVGDASLLAIQQSLSLRKMLQVWSIWAQSTKLHESKDMIQSKGGCSKKSSKGFEKRQHPNSRRQDASWHVFKDGIQANL